MGPGEGVVLEFWDGGAPSEVLGWAVLSSGGEKPPRAAGVDATSGPLGPPEPLCPPAALRRGLGRRGGWCSLPPRLARPQRAESVIPAVTI